MRESGEERSQATRAMATHDIDAVLMPVRTLSRNASARICSITSWPKCKLVPQNIVNFNQVHKKNNR